MVHIAYVNLLIHEPVVVTEGLGVQAAANNRRRKDFHTLPIADRELLESLGYKEKLKKADEAIAKNAAFLTSIVADPEIFGHDLEADDGEDHEMGDETTAATSGPEENIDHGSSYHNAR